MIVGCDCKWVVVDHLHMLVSAVHEGDERRAIDSIMTRLSSLLKKQEQVLILVSHLRRVDGNKGHENGIEVSHLRGSNSIGQLSDCVIALERNQQSEDELEARTTKLRVLKSRYTGDVGMASSLVYDKDTGRLSEEDLEFEVENGEDEIVFDVETDGLYLDAKNIWCLVAVDENDKVYSFKPDEINKGIDLLKVQIKS